MHKLKDLPVSVSAFPLKLSKIKLQMVQMVHMTH